MDEDLLEFIQQVTTDFDRVHFNAVYFDCVLYHCALRILQVKLILYERKLQ